MIRPMRLDDISAVAKIEQICFSDPWSERLLQDSFKNPWNHFWAAENQDGLVIGYGVFSFIAGEGEIQRIGVVPQARRQGTARDLMETMEAFAKGQKGYALTLEVRSGNEAARNLYKSCGFQEEAVRKEYYRHPVEDAVIMWKRDI